MKKTGAQLILEVLLEHGVDTVFGYPGGAALNVYDALYEYQDRIKHILTAHEQGASHAADGYARATGKTGVVFATSGPGATNLVTGIATAYMDSVPMVAITSNVTNNLIGRDAFQEVYITGITMPITKHNFFVNRIEDLANALRQAFRIAQSGRKGPVLVDVTKDVTAALVDYVPERPLPLKEMPKATDAELQDRSRETYLDKEVQIGGWVRSVRGSKNFGFIVVSDGSYFETLQVVYHDTMPNFAEISKLNVGASIIVKGTLVATPEAKQPFEIQATEVAVEGPSASDYPLQKKRHSLEYLRTASTSS